MELNVRIYIRKYFWGRFEHDTGRSGTSCTTHPNRQVELSPNFARLGFASLNNEPAQMFNLIIHEHMTDVFYFTITDTAWLISNQ